MHGMSHSREAERAAGLCDAPCGAYPGVTLQDLLDILTEWTLWISE